MAWNVASSLPICIGLCPHLCATPNGFVWKHQLRAPLMGQDMGATGGHRETLNRAILWHGVSALGPPDGHIWRTNRREGALWYGQMMGPGCCGTVERLSSYPTLPPSAGVWCSSGSSPNLFLVFYIH